jgi:hypothetical protein
VPGLVPPAPRTPTIGTPRIRRDEPPPARFTGFGAGCPTSTSSRIRPEPLRVLDPLDRRMGGASRHATAVGAAQIYDPRV